MVVFYGVKHRRSWLFFGSGRWLRLLGLRAGQPWTAAFAVSFRAVGRWAAIPPRASQGRPKQQQPDRSSSNRSRSAAHASLLHLCAGVKDSWPRGFCSVRAGFAPF